MPQKNEGLNKYNYIKSILKNFIKDAYLFHANKSCISPYASPNMMHFS